MDTYYIWLPLRECISPSGHVNHANIWKCDISTDICLTKVVVWQLNEFPREIKNSKNAKYFMLQSSPWKAVYCYQGSRTRPKGRQFHCFDCTCQRCVISINSNPHGWRKRGNVVHVGRETIPISQPISSAGSFQNCYQDTYQNHRQKEHSQLGNFL